MGAESGVPSKANYPIKIKNYIQTFTSYSFPILFISVLREGCSKKKCSTDFESRIASAGPLSMLCASGSN